MPTTEVKVFRDGTHRVRLPEETWSVIEPKFPRFGITRVADVTGLDTIGIPVAMAVRPLARSLSVAQGKGPTILLAKVSAAMESLEHWHAEHASPAVVGKHVPARELDLIYRMADLDADPGSLVGESTPLDWVSAEGLITGRPVPVPLDLVCLTRPDSRRWTPPGLRRSSNGLASGNSPREAALHALYEVIERETVRGWPGRRRRQGVDPSSVTDPGCAAILAKLRSAGVMFSIEYVPNPFRVPCFAAWIWSEDLPVTSLGFGAHLAPEVALSRAVTESAQSRLTVIAGSREDLPPVYGKVQDGADGRPQAVAVTSTWAEVTAGAAGGSAELGEEIALLAMVVTDVIGGEPLLVDLSTDDDFAVVKVIVPGTGSDLDRFHASH
ncbi:YcaO-like family protein [Micromonospora sp. DT228]|uniref:YcaO-like family protein n=1 Tax=Micromonospora sp. DT228 TaxID=3393443 RepID=UPI003CF0466E